MEGLVTMSAVPQWVEYTLIVVIVLPILIARQLRERTLTVRRLYVLPAVFLLVGLARDHGLVHRLASAPAVAMLAAGLVLAALTGVARAATMRVRRVGGTVLTKGNGRTLALWFATIGLRVAEVAAAYALGVPEGFGEAMLFAAATFGAQGATLAWRGGLFTATPAGPAAAAAPAAPAATAAPVAPAAERTG